MLKQVILVGAMVGFCLPQVHAKNYYKWVDSKGNVTYSSKRPPAGAKQQNIETLRSLGTTSTTSTQRHEFKSNASIPTQYNNPYQNNRATYATRQSERSAEDEALRQKIIKEASTPYKGSPNGQLTANQLRTLAAMNGVDVPTDNSNSRNSYSAPAPQRAPSSITNCDNAGCWGSDGTRYNKAAGNTYFPSTGGSCQNIGGQMQCN